MLLFWILVVLLTLIAGGIVTLPLFPHLKEKKKNILIIITILVSISLLAILLYLKWGASQQLAEMKNTEKNTQKIQLEIKKLGDIDHIIQQLKQTLNKKSDSHGWYLLGKLYLKTQRFQEAIDAFSKADNLQPNQPEILLAYSESLYFYNHKSINEKTKQLLSQLLKLIPNQLEAIELLASDAYQHKDYTTAIHYWESLLSQFSSETEEGKTLLQMIAQAQKKLNKDSKEASPPIKLVVRVEISNILKNKIKGNETLFIYAQSATENSIPLAIIRRKASDLPVEVTLDESVSMVPNINLNTAKNIKVIARISKTGYALKTVGDLEGNTPIFNSHHPAKKILIKIDKERK